MLTSPTTRAPGNFTCYDPLEYFENVVERLGETGAGDTILLATMTFQPSEPAIADLVEALCACSLRGADVTLLVDARTFLMAAASLGPLWSHHDLPATNKLHGMWRERAVALEQLEAAGCTVHIINYPAHLFSNPFARRSHIKTCIINDYLYIGGCNLAGSLDLDIMIGWRDAGTSNWLRTQLLGIPAVGTTRRAFAGRDLTHQIDEQRRLIIDCGVPRQSAILAQALQTIDNAQDWLILTCQFFPNGVTAAHLKKAHDRGVQVRLIFNDPHKLDLVERASNYLVRAREKLRVPPDFFSNQLPTETPFLHAKIIASERELLVGSHNYVRVGVKLGTAEIALYAIDGALSLAAARKIAQQCTIERTEQFNFLQ